MIRDLEMWAIVNPGYRRNEWIIPHTIRPTKREAVEAFVTNAGLGWSHSLDWSHFKECGFRAIRVIVKVAP